MRKTLKQMQGIVSDCCVTIILKTHRTFPDNGKDATHLKNLLRETESRLLTEYGKDIARSYMEKLNELAKKIDHQQNQESLILFVNENISEYERLPIPVTDRIVIDKTFATRELFRSMIISSRYYVLVLNRERARLLEARGGSLTQEITSLFPMDNSDFQAAVREEDSVASRPAFPPQEFFNRVDKQVNKIRTEGDALPVLICSEESNYHTYLGVADYPDTILGHVSLKNFNENPNNIISEVWPFVNELSQKRNIERKEELNQALSSGKYLSDINDIWRAVQEGRGKTIFVQQGYFQPGRINNGAIDPITYDEIKDSGDIDDIIDEMIEFTLQFGGDVVFLPQEELKEFQGLGLVTRY